MDQFNAPQSGGALKITQYAVFIVYQVENNPGSIRLSCGNNK